MRSFWYFSWRASCRMTALLLCAAAALLCARGERVLAALPGAEPVVRRAAVTGGASVQANIADIDASVLQAQLADGAVLKPDSPGYLSVGSMCLAVVSSDYKVSGV